MARVESTGEYLDSALVPEVHAKWRREPYPLAPNMADAGQAQFE